MPLPVEFEYEHEIKNVSEKDVEYQHELETGEKHAGSITEDMLEIICPNGETEYFFEKFNATTEQEALETIVQMIDYHQDDWNLPVEMMDQMKLVVQGPKAYGEFYQRDLRILYYYFYHSSPYAMVRGVVSPVEDNAPAETIRAYLLGLFWALAGTVVNTFFTPRFPSINLGGTTIQIVLYPMGRLLAYILPDWGVTIQGTRYF